MKYINYIILIAIIVVWQLSGGIKFLLPTPEMILNAYINDFSIIFKNLLYSITEAAIGLLIGTILAIVLSILMDSNKLVYKILYPFVLITQTVPTVAIAPLLVIWLGFSMLPKIVLVFLTTFFPILIALLNGFKSIDKDYEYLFKNLEANKLQVYRYLKIPITIPYFLSGFKVALSYSLITAVVSEWLGGYNGLGVYMTRAIKSFALNKLYAAIILISLINILIMKIIKEKK